ncbi:MAG: hypothetical protein U9O94_11210, partial [Nanoarchaeota archaeon]|nr:hypothetical protein [Nanoarchaeota archaeon]
EDGLVLPKFLAQKRASFKIPEVGNAKDINQKIYDVIQKHYVPVLHIDVENNRLKDYPLENHCCPTKIKQVVGLDL